MSMPSLDHQSRESQLIDKALKEGQHKVLYQKLNGDWYAFCESDGEVFYTKLNFDPWQNHEKEVFSVKE